MQRPPREDRAVLGDKAVAALDEARALVAAPVVAKVAVGGIAAFPIQLGLQTEVGPMETEAFELK
ncbi:MAG: hypothetical protein MUE83_01045 [Tabrizicola sp.]|nr:hypothetical protein [Tabrizicola sp.]